MLLMNRLNGPRARRKGLVGTGSQLKIFSHAVNSKGFGTLWRIGSNRFSQATDLHLSILINVERRHGSRHWKSFIRYPYYPN